MSFLLAGCFGFSIFLLGYYGYFVNWEDYALKTKEILDELENQFEENKMNYNQMTLPELRLLTYCWLDKYNQTSQNTEFVKIGNVADDAVMLCSQVVHKPRLNYEKSQIIHISLITRKTSV